MTARWLAALRPCRGRVNEMARNPLTDAEKARIEALHAEGESLLAIGQAIGRPATVVRRYLIAQRLHEPRLRPDMARRKARAVVLYEEGVPTPTILATCGISATTLYQELARQDVPMRYPRIADATREQAVRRWRAVRMSVERVCYGEGIDEA